jgi:hypothetical protein
MRGFTVAKIPVQMWAVLLAFMGVVTALSVLFGHRDANISLAVLAVASNLVSGALGAFAGHQASKADVTTGNGPTTINQNDPK